MDALTKIDYLQCHSSRVSVPDFKNAICVITIEYLRLRLECPFVVPDLCDQLALGVFELD
jgi:hypothetical protein